MNTEYCQWWSLGVNDYMAGRRMRFEQYKGFFEMPETVKYYWQGWTWASDRFKATNKIMEMYG